MTKTIAAIIATIGGLGFALGLIFGQLTYEPSQQELNASAHDLCQELGGTWRTDFNGGWCKI